MPPQATEASRLKDGLVVLKCQLDHALESYRHDLLNRDAWYDASFAFEEAVAAFDHLVEAFEEG